MPSPNRIVIATAGSGKTTEIVRIAAGQSGKSALVTYTNNSTAELRLKSEELLGHVPVNLDVSTWFSFLLRHFVRPYQNALHDAPIGGMLFVNSCSTTGIRKTNVRCYYFSSNGSIYSDKVSEFACALIDATGGKPIRRFEAIFSRLYIDEAQDLAGYDLELVEHLLNSNVEVTLVGDVRQATYQTNHSRKNSQFTGPAVLRKFESWSISPYTALEFRTESHRCVQAVCDFADQFYPNLPGASSLNTKVTGHDGVFCVRNSDVSNYMREFNPQPLRLDRRTKDTHPASMNYGEAKGRTFTRTLLYPHRALLDVVVSGNPAALGTAEKTIAKVYVGITRAKQSVGIVIPDNETPLALSIWEPD